MGYIINNGINYFGDNSVTLTQAQYDALEQAGTVDPNTTYFIINRNNTATTYAAGIAYDNTTSGLTATNVQGAIDELGGDVDELEASVSNYNLQAVAASITSSYVTGGNIWCYKHGGTLVLKANGIKFSTYSGRITIGTAPVGFRPPFESTGFFDSSSITFGVLPNGNIWVNQEASGSQFWGMLTTVLA